jgi:hypothetical protein
MQDWDLVLSWGMEPGRLRVCVELAATPICPHARFFLMVLYHWVAVVARDSHIELRRTMYDRWLEVVRGVTDPAVKRWRHRAKLVFQGAEPFSWEQWWAGWAKEQEAES